MPLVQYGFKCVNENCEQRDFTEMLERDSEHKANCPLCRKPAQRVFSLAAVTVGFRAGFDVGLGQHVNSERERNNILAKDNLRRIKC